MGKNAPALSNYNAGELSPDFDARVDNEKYAVGCDTLQNFIPLIQGPARRRPGSRIVQFVKDSSQRTWLRKFIFSQGQAYQIEFGAGYIRFYTNHGQVQSGGSPYEIASPYTALNLTNADNTCGLQIEQSGDVLYIACGSVWPMILTRLGGTNWVLAPYAPPDGPFLDQNASNSPALYIAHLSATQVTCFATAPVFDPSDVATASHPGRLVRIQVQYYNTPTWANQQAYSTGDLVRFNGNTYKALNSGTSGPASPIQTQGTQYDGKGGVLWLYLDSGYGIGQVTAYTSATQVTLTLSLFAGQTGKGRQSYSFPSDTIGTTATITAISKANPCVVTAANSFAVGDPVYLTGVAGMVEVSDQMYTVSAATGANFTLSGIDSTGFTTYTSGGTAIKNASLNWQIGAWGQGLAAYAGSYPKALSFYADRLFFGSGIRYWGSTPGQYDSHAQDQFSQITASCALAGIIAAQEVDAITWMQAALYLLIGTNGGEFALQPLVNTQALGPGNVEVARQTKLRSRAIRAEIIGTSNFYVQASGKKVMAQDYSFYLDRYDSTNQNRLANHIAGYSVGAGIIDIGYHAEPYETLWGVRNDGILIGYVFDRQDNVTGWHEHTLGGTLSATAVVECVSVIPAPDGIRDEVWLIVKRVINGQTMRSIEYLEKDFETGDLQNSMCYLDLSSQYSGTPTKVVTGLSYLEGETVSVLRDGGGHPDCIVHGGQIALQTSGSVVQVGLRCPATLVTMDIEGGADVGTAQGKVKRAAIATVRVKNTLGGHIGMKGGTLALMQPNVSTTNLGSPPPLTTGDIARISFPGEYDTRCKIEIQQPDPFQMEILGIFPSITINEPSPP